MFTTSAALALVLHLPPHPLPRQPIPHTYTSSTSASAYVRGDLSPWPMLPQSSAPIVVAMESGKTSRQQSQAQNPSEPNLDQILPGDAFAPARSSASPPGMPPPQAPQPTYESWDVLRQYPHTAPLAPPASAPTVPERSTKSPSMEKHDVQTPHTPSP